MVGPRKEAQETATYHCRESGELLRPEILPAVQGLPSTQARDLGSVGRLSKWP